MNRYIFLKSVIFLFVLLLPASRFCEGQALWGKTPSERNLMQQLREIASYARHLRDDCEDALTPAAREQLDSINSQVNDILTIMPKSFQIARQLSPPDGSEAYRKIIGNYDQILLWFDTAMQVLNAPNDVHLFNRIADTLGKTLAFIREDVQLQYIAGSIGKELVPVVVKVVEAGGKEQSGYQVFVKPYISFNPALTTRFDRVSKDIPAGWKLCWIEKNDRPLQQQEWRVKSNDTSTHHLVFILK